MATARFKRMELETHNHRNNLVIVIDNLVYDVTEFLDDHPGGVEVLLDNGGKDASKCFHDVGHSEIALDWRQNFLIGEVVDEDKWEVKRRDATPPEPEEPVTLGGLLNLWGPPVVIGLVAGLLYMYLFQ